MKNTNDFISMCMIAISGIFLLSLGFSVIPYSAHGNTTVNLHWFNISLFILALSTLFSELTSPKIGFKFLLPDLLILLLAGSAYFSYNHPLNASPEKLIYLFELTAMWFLMRINLNKYPSLRLFFISIMIICGLISIFVFNIMLVNKKDVFAEFELFSNIKLSNAYAAYLAFILPLSLNGLLIFRKGNILNHKLDSRFLACCFYSISLIIITFQVIIHPAKNIWISIILSCSWIFWMRLIGWNKTNHFINKYKKIISITSVSAFLILSFFSTQGYLKKLEIGDNRLLKQNITTKAILEHPVKGIGYGMFNKVFSQTQAAYFITDQTCEIEKRNASCPDFAGNEFLQNALELGLTGFIFYSLFFISVLYYGIKYRHIGTSAAIFALMIYGSYSDYMIFPSFWVTPFFLSVIAVSKRTNDETTKSFSIIQYSGIIAAIVAIIFVWTQKDIKKTYVKWFEAQQLYQNRRYKEASLIYTDLYPALNHQPDFIYEAAKCFHHIDSYHISSEILNRGLQISSQINLYHLMADNKIKQGKYEDAEYYLLEAYQILPYSGETSFYLILLYNNPHYKNTARLHDFINNFNHIRSFNQTNITDEMIVQVKQIMQEIKTDSVRFANVVISNLSD